MTDWKETTFNQAVCVNPSVPMERGKQYPFVEMKAIEPGNRSVSESEIRVFKGGGARFIHSDTLMARITPCLENGKIARYMPLNGSGPAHGSTEFIVIRGREQVTDNDFAYYLTCWDGFRNFAISQMTGSSGRQRVPVDALNKFELRLPPLSTQKRIAKILGSLDDKIELNRKQNETLEAMARAVFQSWFVDFDPVIDNALAAGRPIPDELAEKAARRKHHKTKHPLPQAIQSLFPNRFEPSPLGPIPKGWKAGKLGDISLNIRKPARLDTIDPESAYIGLEHMPQRCIALSEWGKAGEVASNKFKFTEGQILFGKLRPYFHKVGVAVTDGICSTDILVVEPKAEKWFGVVLSYLSSYALIEYATSHSSGTRMPRTNWNDLAKYPIAIAPDEISRHFTAMVADYVHMLKTNINESKTLTQLRDSLLPKLLTGEIEV